MVWIWIWVWGDVERPVGYAFFGTFSGGIRGLDDCKGEVKEKIVHTLVEAKGYEGFLRRKWCDWMDDFLNKHQRDHGKSKHNSIQVLR